MGLHGVKSPRILNGSLIHSVILDDIRWISMRIGLGYVTIHVTNLLCFINSVQFVHGIINERYRVQQGRSLDVVRRGWHYIDVPCT
jgi:hypothetical protein